MDTRKDTIWQSSAVAKNFLKGIRGAIPFAAEQLDIMLRVLDLRDEPIRSFIDLGCGAGALGAVILERYPDARGVFIDFSPAMLDAAKRKLGDNPNVTLSNLDYATPDWLEAVEDDTPFDAVVSGYSIHHHPDERKRRVYTEIFDLLAPGGVFMNIEHVAPTSEVSERLFEEHLIDNLLEIEQRFNGPRSRDQLAEEFRNREDGEANILAPLDLQLDWLKDIGYTQVDCHFKLYELAIFGGAKPR